MPWTAKDAESKTKKADTAKKREVWAKVANETLKREQGKGNKDAEATAVKEANSAVANMKEDELLTHGRLQEFTSGATTPLKVDAEKGIVYDVLFLGLHSRNRADYPRQVMEEALPQYEGALSYAGHARDGVNPDPDKAFGVPRNCHVTADGIRGDYYFPPKHRLAEDLVWRAQNAPKSVGFSHDADCNWDVRSGRKIVNKISRVYSVDYVTRPATTSGLFEEEGDDSQHTTPSLQEETKMGVEWKDITVELLSTNCPDLVSKLQGTDEHTRLTEEVKTLKESATAQATELATLKAEKAARLREQEIAADLTAAKFPVNDPVVYSAEFKEELAAAPDKAKRDRLIKDRLAVAKGRIQEGVLPAPLTNLKEEENDNRHHSSANASLFVAK